MKLSEKERREIEERLRGKLAPYEPLLKEYLPEIIGKVVEVVEEVRSGD